MTKAIRDWGELFGIHGKAMESLETWRTEALKSFAISKSRMQGGEAKRNLTWSILDDSRVSHFWSTSWSPNYACYMSLAQEVNNPMLQTICDSELKWKSYSHWKPITPSWRKILHGYEMLSFCCEISQPSYTHSCGVLLKLPDICDWHFEIFCFRYLMSKSPNSPCNPPIIGFLSL